MKSYTLVFFVVATILCLFHKSVMSQDTDGNTEHDSIPSVLLESALNNDIDGIHRALEAGESIDVTNDKGWSAARFAVALGDLQFLRALVDAGIDLNLADHDGVTPLMAAAGEVRLPYFLCHFSST
jgi:ankyrin repeat protein